MNHGSYDTPGKSNSSCYSSAAGMDPEELKKKYGKSICFWGAMDTQFILSKGSVKEVKSMVEEGIEKLGKGGGFVLSGSHNIQPDIPLDNILTLYRHAREYVPSFSKY